MPLLKLDKDDPQKELEFEVKCALEQDPSVRLDRWLEWNIDMLKFAEENQKRLGLNILDGYQDASQIIKRS